MGERESQTDREQAHSEEHYTEQRSAFTRAVITAAHSVHLTSPLDSLCLALCHSQSAGSEHTVCLSGWNNRIHSRKWNSGTPVIIGKHLCDVMITAGCFDTKISSRKLCSSRDGIVHCTCAVMRKRGSWMSWWYPRLWAICLTVQWPGHSHCLLFWFIYVKCVFHKRWVTWKNGGCTVMINELSSQTVTFTDFITAGPVTIAHDEITLPPSQCIGAIMLSERCRVVSREYRKGRLHAFVYWVCVCVGRVVTVLITMIQTHCGSPPNDYHVHSGGQKNPNTKWMDKKHFMVRTHFEESGVTIRRLTVSVTKIKLILWSPACLSVSQSVSQQVPQTAGQCRKLIDAIHISSSRANRPQQPLWRILETGRQIHLRVPVSSFNKPSACLALADPAHVSCGRTVLPPRRHTSGFVLLKFSPHNPHKHITTWERVRMREKGG